MKFIINADDFGMSESVNRAIADAFQKGWISNTTIMVNMPYAEQAAGLARENGFFDRVGLHFNVSEGPPVTGAFAANPELTDSGGRMTGFYRRSLQKQFFIGGAAHDAVTKEAEAQVRRYLELGFTQMHCDSHHHTHNYLSIYSALEPALKRYGFRSVRPAKNMNHHVRYVRPDKRLYKLMFNARLRGAFERRADYFMSFDEYRALGDRNFKNGVIELMCHPDYEGEKLINRGNIGFGELSGRFSGGSLISYGELAGGAPGKYSQLI